MTEPPRAPDQPTSTSAAQSVETRTRVLWLDGVRWIVRETDQPTLDRRAGRSLIFESDEIVRRLREYPDDWFALSDDALYRLSLGRLASDPWPLLLVRRAHAFSAVARVTPRWGGQFDGQLGQPHSET